MRRKPRRLANRSRCCMRTPLNHADAAPSLRQPTRQKRSTHCTRIELLKKVLKITTVARSRALPLDSRTMTCTSPDTPARERALPPNPARCRALPRILHDAVHFPESLHPVVHFPVFPHGDAHFPSIPARCRALPRIPARGRALPSNPCIAANSCKETGEVHVPVQENGGSARRNGNPTGLSTCTSPISLHEMGPLQGIGRSARQPARKHGKCTSACKELVEVHGRGATSCKESGEVHGSGSAACKKSPGVHGSGSAACRKSREVHAGGCVLPQGIGRNARRSAKKWRKRTRPLASGNFRAFPHHPCTQEVSCKDMGGMCDSLQRNGGNGRKTTCRAGRKTLISGISLHEFLHVQQMRGTARKRPCGPGGRAC